MINPDDPWETLLQRKKRHLDICLDRKLPIESGHNGLDSFRLPHCSLPHVNLNAVTLNTPFLGYDLKLPVMISCMTGGSDKGQKLNRLLAQVAGAQRIAFGLGSIRAMLEHPERQSDFQMRQYIPDSPILANIGVAQLGQYSTEQLREAIKTVQADGLYVHLNGSQELFQDGGDTNFAEWRNNLRRLIETADFPILVKEIGAGIPPSEGLDLLRWGAAYVDVAGSGGTDWVAVETIHKGSNVGMLPHAFYSWGYPTAELLAAYRLIARTESVAGKRVRNCIIASGGLRKPKDFALSIATGAYLSAAALPFIREAAEHGSEGVHQYIETIYQGLRNAIVLSGAVDLDGFRRIDLQCDADLSSRAGHLIRNIDL